MKTSSVYHGFAMQQEELLKELLTRVRAATPVETLFLLGITTAHTRTETLFSDPSLTRSEVAHVYLLALVQKEDDHSLSSIQDKIENNLQHFLPVTAIVFSIGQFINWLAEGHPFAAVVREKAWLLYQKEEAPLPFPSPVNSEQWEREAAQLFAQTKIKVTEFLAGAELYTVRMQYKLAAFMLHQSAEQALRTMMIIHTGLRLNTHSIDRLVRCCTLFCYKLPDVFPRTTEKEKRLFQLLQKAYIDTRYKDDYTIRGDEVTLLTQMVKALYGLLVEWQCSYTA